MSAKDGAGEMEALVEASMHSSAAFGNITMAENENDRHDNDNNDTTSPSISPNVDANNDFNAPDTQQGLGREGINLDAAFPLNIRSIRSVVTSSQIFSRVSGEDEFIVDYGIAHLSFLVDQSLHKWKREISLSHECLDHAYQAKQRMNKTNQVCAQRNLALVCYRVPTIDIQEARFVHWQIPGQTGRPISLDEHNRVKALVCVGSLRTPLDLSSGSIVHPDTGIAMLRARGHRYQERPLMPANMLRLQLMCELALQTGGTYPGDDSSNVGGYDDLDDSSCILCTRRILQAPFPDSLSQGRVFRCPLCLEQLAY